MCTCIYRTLRVVEYKGGNPCFEKLRAVEDVEVTRLCLEILGLVRNMGMEFLCETLRSVYNV